MIEPWRVPAISDEAFLTVSMPIVERSTALDVSMVEDGIYYVEGGCEPHWVNLFDPDAARCDCYDHLVREHVCKHVVAVLIARGDKRILRRLCQLRDELRRELGHQ